VDVIDFMKYGESGTAAGLARRQLSLLAKRRLVNMAGRKAVFSCVCSCEVNVKHPLRESGHSVVKRRIMCARIKL